MKHAPLPRSPLVALLLLVSLTLLVGSLHAFTHVQASDPSLAPTISLPTESVTPSAVGSSLAQTETPVRSPTPVIRTHPSEDTTGIAAMAGMILLIVLLGVLVGLQKPPHNRKHN